MLNATSPLDLEITTCLPVYSFARLLTKNSKNIRKSLKISGVVVGVIILLLATTFFLLQTSRVQQAVAQSVMRSISDKVQSEVSIGRVDYKFFNTIALQDVYVEDLQGDTLLYVQELDAHFNLLRFFMGKVIFYSVAFDGLHGNLQVDENGESNLAFLIKAFSNPDKQPKANDVEYRINAFQLKNSSLQFTNLKNLQGKPKAPQDRMDFNRLYFDHINAEVSLDVLNKDTLSAKIKHFSGEERSGLKLTQLATEVYASNKQVDVPYFHLSLPHSKLKLADITLNFDSTANLDNFAEQVLLSGKLEPSYLKLDDIGGLVPELDGMEATATLEAELSGRLSNLRVQGIKVQYGESFVLNGQLDLNGLPDLQQTFVYGNLKELKLNGEDTERFLSDFTGDSIILPEEVKQLGTISYRGNISGFFSNLVIYGNLKTNVGSLSTDILLQFENDFRDINYNGTLKSSGLDLGRMLMSDKVGSIAFYFNTTGSRKMNDSFQGVIDANVPELSLLSYQYRDIRFNGEYDGNGFNGRLAVEDENINLHFNGLIDLTQRLPVFDFALTVKDTKLQALGLTSSFPESALSFNGKTNMTGNSLDNINGYIRFDSIQFRNADKELNVDEVLFTSHTEESYTDFSIASNYLNGSISGNFKYTSLAPMAVQTLKKYLPSLNVKELKNDYLNHIDIDLSIANTQDLADVFGSPYSLAEVATIKGLVDEELEEIDVVATLPKIISGTQGFNNTTLHLWGEPKKLEFIVESNIPTSSDYWNVALYTTAQNDTLLANLEWRNRQQVVNRGDFRTLTRFLQGKDKRLATNTSILPSDIIISDSLWNVSAQDLAYREGALHVDNFLFGNERQYLSVDGTASKNKEDSLNIVMQDIDLGFISTITGMKGFHIGGITTGNALVLSALERPIFDAILSVKDLKLNHVLMGDASIFSTWDQINEQVVAIASINDANATTVLAECTYSPSQNVLDVELDANRLSLDFLEKYYDGILPNTTGYASGKMRIGGPLSAIRFDGRLMVNDGQVTVGILGSTFHFNDTIAMTPTSIEFPDLTLYDAERNKVTLDGELTHDGTFKDFKYNLNITTKDAQVANLNPGDNDLFFGKAYADASVRITGDEEEVVIRANALTKPGTKIFIQTNTTATTTDAGFIQFVKHEEEDADILYTPRMVNNTRSNSNLKLNLQLEATPSAEIELIIDPVGGDMISGKGNGNLRIEYDANQADTKMYGSYTIESGKYLFNLQDVFRKEFKIESGSTVLWTGSPSDAQVNIKAIYSLTASLKGLLDEDLLQSLSNWSTRLTVPVHCILLLSDELMSPTIKFDIDLPSSEEAVKQMVRSVINTDEMLTRQILYLLVFNQFYKVNEQDVAGGGEFFSLAFSTVSSQLNNLISQFTQSNKVSFGMDMRRVDETNLEVGVDVLYQPNDRWVVNGNFGYRENNNNIADYNQYITDVDIEYLLTKSGKLSLKFYNHTIDRTVQLRTAKNTQGAGIVYKENFDGVLDMFRYYWRALTSIGKKNKEKGERKKEKVEREKAEKEKVENRK